MPTAARNCGSAWKPAPTPIRSAWATIPEEQLSVYVTARQYGSLSPDKTFVETLDRLRQLCHEAIDGHVIEHILQPLGRAISMQ